MCSILIYLINLDFKVVLNLKKNSSNLFFLKNNLLVVTKTMQEECLGKRKKMFENIKTCVNSSGKNHKT